MEKKNTRMKVNVHSEFSECTTRAPASTANLGPGYDVFGLGLDALEDIVTVRIKKKSNSIKNNLKIIIKGNGKKDIPNNPNYNSAGIVARKIISEYNLYNYNCLIEIEKNIPAGYGMGSSAASAVATAISFNSLFGLDLDESKLLDYSAEGELASAGVKHYDNIAGSLFGNFVIIKTYPKLEFIKIKSPTDLVVVVCVPLIKVPKMKTEISRKLIPKKVPLEKTVHNIANACSIVAGFYNQDVNMICNGINDCIIEPVRKKMIPGYDKIKKRSLEEGAMAFTISGAGPSSIAFLNSRKKGLHIAEVMKEEYEKIDIRCETYLAKPSNGATIISKK
ncbi:homoserine kinase [Candidatus Nitrosocosmicus franklandus]|nr:homoserine kinase [Candidatus Nitrosocosmicus franklandus]